MSRQAVEKLAPVVAVVARVSHLGAPLHEEVDVENRPAVLHVIYNSGVHPDGIAGACLHAETAEYAAQYVDIIAAGSLFHRRVFDFLGLDMDAVSRAVGGAQHASGAAGPPVFVLHQPVGSPVIGRLPDLLVRVVHRDDAVPLSRQQPSHDRTQARHRRQCLSDGIQGGAHAGQF